MSWTAPRAEEIATSAEIGGYQDDLERGEPRPEDDRARRPERAPRVAGAAERSEAE